MLLGWFVYSKFIASRIFKLDDSFVTPAYNERWVDYVPTNKVEGGHHFTSVAGLHPLQVLRLPSTGMGSCGTWVARYDIVSGVHLWRSVGCARHKGKSMGALSETVIGERFRSLFGSDLPSTLMVNAVFGGCRELFVSQPNRYSQLGWQSQLH